MSQVIAIVGRPNVGKSTLFNYLTRTRDALVADMPGLTRDRKYGIGKIGDVPYTVVDTGGLSEDDHKFAIESLMAQQVRSAIDEADGVWFMVDAKVGVTAADASIAQYLRQQGKPVQVVVNKIDGKDERVVGSEFYELGLGDPACIAAAHGRGIRSLVSDFFEHHLEPADSVELEAFDKHAIKVAVIGRPNVGKSTLINRILGENRVVAFDKPGTTRDSVYIPFEKDDKSYVLIDTAGIRRRKNVKEVVEKFSIIKTLRAIDDANVVVMMLDAHQGIADQDAHLLGYALEKGRAIVMSINKWDGLDDNARNRVRAEFAHKFPYLDFVRLHFISALHGSGVGNLFGSILEAHKAAFAELATARLTQILQDAQVQHQPPLVRGRRIKLRYAHQGGSNPPIIVIHGNQTERLPDAYQRFLINIFRKVFCLVGTPLRLQLKSSDNPFQGKRQTLTPRQEHKRKRLKKFTKKQDRRTKS